MRPLIGLCVLVIVALAGAIDADAHATYVRSNPAPDARLLRAPREVRAAFSEPPDPRGSEIRVFDASGRRVDRGDAAASDETNGLRVSLELIGDGGYAVVWTVLSAIDGHATHGTFAFAVGDAPLPSLAEIAEAAPPPRPLEIAGRALSFAGIALALGVGLFALAIRRVRDLRQDGREQLLLAVAGAALVAGAVLLLLEQGGRAPARLTAVLGARGLAGVAILALASVLAPRALAGVAVTAGLVAAATATLVSHAAAVGPLEMALDLAHVVSASAWAGGVVAVGAFAIGRSLWTDADAGELGSVVRRFSLLAVGAVALLLATGTVQSLQRLVLLEDLVETPYGLALLAKVLLLAVTLVLGAVNLLVLGPRLRPQPSELVARRAPAARRALIATALAETALLAAVVVAAAALTALAPPAQPSGAAFDATRHAGGLRLQLLVARAQPGEDRFVLRVHDGPRPVAHAQKVALRFTMVEHEMGEAELVAEERGPGEYVAKGAVAAMVGTWRIEAVVRLAGRADARTVFTVPVMTPTGPGAVARAIAAPPYSMVAFVAPPQPVAGAPLTLHLVVVDAAGEPTVGKSVIATFRGPATERVTAREGARGQYEFALAGLEAGRWEATIEIGDEARAVYAFDVVR